MKSKKNIKSVLIIATIGIIALFFLNISLAANMATVNVETANVRETADSEGKILVQLSQNEQVEVLEKTDNWYKVKAKGTTGYLREDLITLKDESTLNETNKEQTTNTETPKAENTEQENVEQENTQTTKTLIAKDTKLKIVPAINATDIIEVKENEEVTTIDTINDWVCVKTGTTKGWIRKENLKEEKQQEQTQNQEQVADTNNESNKVEETVLKTLYINTDTVNLRKEANTSSEIVTKLSLNTAVDVYAEENNWSKVKVNGKEGYISSSLLSNKKQETSRSMNTSRSQLEQQQQTQQQTQQQQSTTVAPSTIGANVVETARQYLGCAYVYGASGPSSFDCSGFTSYIFRLHGVSLNRTAAGQYSNGVYVSRDQLQPGDLVMFGTSASNITHVAIYIGGGQIIHAANKSTISTITSGYYNNRYVGARRVM